MHALIYIIFSHVRTHTYVYMLTLWYSLSFSLSLSPSFTNNPQSMSTLYTQMAMSVSKVLQTSGSLTVSTFAINIKEMTDSAQSCFLMITCTLWGTKMAAVSKCSNLFLFYLTIKLKKTVLYCQKYNYWKSALSVSSPHTQLLRHISPPVTICAVKPKVLWMLI